MRVDPKCKGLLPGRHYNKSLLDNYNYYHNISRRFSLEHPTETYTVDLIRNHKLIHKVDEGFRYLQPPPCNCCTIIMEEVSPNTFGSFLHSYVLFLFNILIKIRACLIKGGWALDALFLITFMPIHKAKWSAATTVIAIRAVRVGVTVDFAGPLCHPPPTCSLAYLTQATIGLSDTWLMKVFCAYKLFPAIAEP